MAVHRPQVRLSAHTFSVTHGRVSVPAHAGVTVHVYIPESEAGSNQENHDCGKAKQITVKSQMDDFLWK